MVVTNPNISDLSISNDFYQSFNFNSGYSLKTYLY